MDHSGKTLLIAEDSADEVFIIRRALSKSGLPLQVRFVPNGQEAIDYLERKPPYNNSETFPMPAAVLLDINMPLVSGLGVLAWLKLHPTLNHLPAIIHTSSAHHTDRQEAARLGAHAYHVKGSMDDLNNLFHLIHDLMHAPATAAAWDSSGSSSPPPSSSGSLPIPNNVPLRD